MATQIDPNFVITADSVEGYKIVKYLGTVTGYDRKAMTIGKTYFESFSKNQSVMIQMAEERGANAIVGVRVILPDILDVGKIAFYGTAVIIEPINK